MHTISSRNIHVCAATMCLTKLLLIAPLIVVAIGIKLLPNSDVKKTYLFADELTRVTYHDAVDFCAQNGATVFKLDHDSEIDFLATELKPKHFIFLGVKATHQSEPKQWLDGDYITNYNYEAIEFNTYGQFDCATIVINPFFTSPAYKKWHSAPCNHLEYVICQLLPDYDNFHVNEKVITVQRETSELTKRVNQIADQITTTRTLMLNHNIELQVENAMLKAQIASLEHSRTLRDVCEQSKLQLERQLVRAHHKDLHEHMRMRYCKNGAAPSCNTICKPCEMVAKNITMTCCTQNCSCVN